MDETPTTRRGGLTLLAVAAVALTVVVSAGAGPLPRDLQAVKAASARFHSLAQAARAGYLRESPCIPGEGIHYGKPSLLMDAELDPKRPELLLYELKPSGKLRLVGVEYFIAADAVSSRPSLFGQAFVGPMPGHSPGQPAHYELHVSLWQPNPNGIFAQANPNVDC
jgi:hypothetical protein